jgi:hypothetical protein
MPTKERRTVRVDLETFSVYPDSPAAHVKRIGTVVEYVRNDGARIRRPKSVSKPFTTHRLTAKFPDDERAWVGQIKNEEMEKKSSRRKSVILRPAPVNSEAEKLDA